MDHTAGKRAAAGSGGPIGTAAQGTRSSPAPAFRLNVAATGRKRRGTQRETPRPPGGNARRLPGGKRKAPGRKLAAAMPETRSARRALNAADYHPPGGNAAGQRRPPAETRNQRATAADRTPGAYPGERPPGLTSLPGRSRQFVGGRTSRRTSELAGRGGPAGSLFPDHKFRDRKHLLAASETTIIHSLTGQLLERDQPLPPNGQHIRSPPQPWAATPTWGHS